MHLEVKKLAFFLPIFWRGNVDGGGGSSSSI